MQELFVVCIYPPKLYVVVYQRADTLMVLVDNSNKLDDFTAAH